MTSTRVAREMRDLGKQSPTRRAFCWFASNRESYANRFRRRRTAYASSATALTAVPATSHGVGSKPPQETDEPAGLPAGSGENRVRRARRVVAVDERNEEQHRSIPSTKPIASAGRGADRATQMRSAAATGRTKIPMLSPVSKLNVSVGTGERPGGEPAPSFGGSGNRTVPERATREQRRRLSGLGTGRSSARQRIGSPCERLRRRDRRQRRQRARVRGAAGEGGQARLRPRAERLARRGDPDRGDHRARLPPRRLQRVASALGRRRRARAARRRPGGARARVPEHRAPDGDAVPRRRGGVPLAVGRCERGRIRSPPPGDGDAWRALLDEFLPTADLAFGILGTELWSRHGVALALKAYRRLGRRGAVDFAGRLVVSARDRLTETFASERAHGLLAPWVLHTGLGPDAAASGYMAQVIAVAVQEGGMPIPRGGGAKLADALVAFIRARGGTCSTGVQVERVLVSGGRAVGVETSDGEQIGARDVICNVTPTQLYGKLLPDVPPDLAGKRRGSGTGARRCRSTSRSPSRRRGRATSGWRRRRSSTSRPASTASRAPSTRPSAGSCRRRRRSSSASR